MEWSEIPNGIILALAKWIIQSVRQWRDKRREAKAFEKYRITHRKAFGKVRLPSDEPTTMWILYPRSNTRIN